MIEEQIGKLKAEVFKRVKILEQIYEEFGHLTLFEYIGKWKTRANSVDKNVLDIIEKFYEKLFGKVIAQKAIKQIQNFPLVSTIDHHGIFGHPFFLNANLLFSLRKNMEFLPIFSTNGVSLNNSSWPGSLYLINFLTKQPEKVSFFRDFDKAKTVFSLKSFVLKDVGAVLEKIDKISFLSVSQKQKLKVTVEKVFKNPEVLESQSFSDQASKASFGLWGEVFPNVPKLIYLSLEELVSEIIMRLVAPDTKHPLHLLFFERQGLKLLKKYFFGLKGAFGKGKGSFLFWGVGENGKRYSFRNEEFCITNDELGISHSLSPEAIIKVLKEKKIYPTSLVCFLIMLYYNFNCIGGFNQTSWLTVIKEKFSELLGEIGEKDKKAEIRQTVTDNFAETTLVLVSKDGKIFKPSLLDLYLNNITYKECVAQAKKITLAQSIECELPEIYKIVVPKEERQIVLEKIGLENIVEQINVAKITY